MKLELVDSVPLSNEIIDSFYKNLEQQQKDAERLEELEYNESKTIITRRKFMQYSALSAVGLGLGLSTEKAEAGILPLIPLGLLLLGTYLRAQQASVGNIIIVNPNNTPKKDIIELELVSSEPIDSSSVYAGYNVPAHHKNKYRYKDGPRADTNKDILAYLQASNGHGSSIQSSEFWIRA